MPAKTKPKPAKRKKSAGSKSGAEPTPKRKKAKASKPRKKAARKKRPKRQKTLPVAKPLPDRDDLPYSRDENPAPVRTPVENVLELCRMLRESLKRRPIDRCRIRACEDSLHHYCRANLSASRECHAELTAARRLLDSHYATHEPTTQPVAENSVCTTRDSYAVQGL